jgi:16S rRNA (adenine1518-N6/adenine1519-N6)-dimethyltransferase
MSRLRLNFKKYQIQPLKRLGQNFLVDKLAIKKIVTAAELSFSDIVVEIGPGFGNLTKELAKKVKKVIAIEKDPRMINILSETLKEFNNIEIIQGDVLKMQNADFKLQNYNPKFKIVANLPFYLTAPLIRKFLESEIQPELIVLIIQKEVAQRICAKPPDMNLLAVSVQFYAKTKIITYIPRTSFWPQPKVDSAIIRITPTIGVNKKSVNVDLFFKIVKAGFSQPRKQLANNLSKKLKLSKDRVKTWLLANNIKPDKRAETLNLKDWLNLTKSL